MTKKGYKWTKKHKKNFSLSRNGMRVSPKTEFKKGHKLNLGKRWGNSNKKNSTKKTNKTGFKKGSIELRKHLSLKLKGKIKSKETIKKLRLSTIKYLKEVSGFICPRIGNNEKQILDKLEKEMEYKIIRQYQCEGYFIDGYIKELNLAIEVDEIPKNKEKDIEREKIIKDKLNCKFLRIKDYD